MILTLMTNCDRQPVSTVDAMNALTVLRGRLVKSYPDLSRHHSRADLCFVSPLLDTG